MVRSPIQSAWGSRRAAMSTGAGQSKGLCGSPRHTRLHAGRDHGWRRTLGKRDAPKHDTFYFLFSYSLSSPANTATCTAVTVPCASQTGDTHTCVGARAIPHAQKFDLPPSLSTFSFTPLVLTCALALIVMLSL